MRDVFYTERGGVLYGGETLFEQTKWSFPFAKLSLSDVKLCIVYPFGKKVVFLKNDISSIEPIFRGINSGIQINHKQGHLPMFFVFWSMNSQRLLNILCDHNWIN